MTQLILILLLFLAGLAVALLGKIARELQRMNVSTQSTQEGLSKIAATFGRAQSLHSSSYSVFTPQQIEETEDRLKYASEKLWRRLEEHEKKYGKESSGWSDEARQELLYPYSAYYLASLELRQRLEANLEVLRGKTIEDVEAEFRLRNQADRATELARAHVGIPNDLEHKGT